MHIGYREVYSYSFRLFFDAWSESSRNSLFILKEWKFRGAKVLGTFAPEEQKFHRSETSKERMFHGTKVPSVDFLLPGTKEQRNEKSDIPVL